MREFTEKDAIRNLQIYLRAQRLRDESAMPVPIDGIFDTATKNALFDFQLKNSLPPTGRVDRDTFELLYSQYLDAIKQEELPAAFIPFPSYPKDYMIEEGERSFLVATVQYMLNEISVIFNTLEPLEINGIFDGETVALVKELQLRSSLEVTGKVDRATWAVLARIYDLSIHYIDQN